MKYDVFVIQIVADGPDGFPKDAISDIAICGVDLEKMEVRSIYSMFVKHELTDEKIKYLEQCSVTADMIASGMPAEDVCADVKRILNGKTAASFDVRNVFFGYMVNEPWDLTKEVSVMPSICSRLPMSRYSAQDENTKIRETYIRMFPGDPMNAGNGMRALDHALMTAAILMELRKRELY